MKKILCLGVLTLSLSGCLMTRNEVKEAEGRRSTQDQVQTMQRTAAAEASNRVSEMEGSIRELNGRVEVVENKIGQSDQSAARGHRQLEEQLSESNKKVQLLQEEVTKLEGQVQALAEQVAANAAANARKDKDDDAKADDKGKGDKKTSFDTAEEHFNKKEWRKAVLNYQKYRDQYPKGKKFAEATYKIGVCFQELGMKDEARTFYEELIAKFKGSPEARRAQIRLKKLK